jgi:hypothetical protein
MLMAVADALQLVRWKGVDILKIPVASVGLMQLLQLCPESSPIHEYQTAGEPESQFIKPPTAPIGTITVIDTTNSQYDSINRHYHNHRQHQ